MNFVLRSESGERERVRFGVIWVLAFAKWVIRAVKYCSYKVNRPKIASNPGAS